MNKHNILLQIAERYYVLTIDYNDYNMTYAFIKKVLRDFDYHELRNDDLHKHNVLIDLIVSTLSSKDIFCTVSKINNIITKEI
jgi:hypothetical protein